MTIKDLQRIVLTSEQSTPEDSPAMKELLKRTRDKRFWWVGDPTEHARRHKLSNGNCCFNHIIGLPKKNGEEKGFFDYQRNIYKALFTPSVYNARAPTAEEAEKYRKLLIAAELKSQTKSGNIKKSQTKSGNIKNTHAEVMNQKTNELVYPFKVKHLWIKKATGLGITEFLIRIMCWLCMKNDNYKGSQAQMVVVTGPNQDLAIKIIKRMKGLFEPHGITFDSSMTVLNLNGCEIQAYPSNHIDAFRSLTNPRFILLDECDFFPKHQQEEVRHVSERYIAKSDPFICMVSTPNAPGGLLERIEKEPLESSIYKKLFLHWSEGLGKIYSEKEIEKAKKSPSFEREYCLMYQGLIGNVFAPAAIEKVQQIEYDPDNIIPDCKVSIGVDPSFGSKFGIVATRFANERIEVIEAEEYNRPDFNDMTNRIWELKQKHKVDNNNLTIYVDSANPEIWQSLKRMVNEPYSEKYVFDKLLYYRKNNLNPAGPGGMIVIPTAFNTNGAKMLQAAKSLVEDKDNLVVIDKRFDKLLTALRTAVANEYKLDKEQTSYHDILDAFRLSLQLYQRSNK
jgi:hypothetical protein